ncbi:MAG: DUF3108 domain-containing protein [Deltaproteobacteria bacterium]|nr:DUF3108 domain-containing protein [Deltaproteobacteria bacterium]
MDRGARDIVNGRVGKGISAFLLLALLLVQAGCHRGGRGETPSPPEQDEFADDNTAPADVTEWLPPVVATEEAEEAVGTSPPDNTAIGAPGAVAPAVPPDNAARSESPPSAGTKPGRTSPADATPPARRPKPAAAPHPNATSAPKDTRGASPPEWAKSPEELVYRVDFIGITMGYARFRYRGKVSIAGKPAYHLNVRAWTSGILSFIFPINETIDYYLDTETIAPIRQEFTQREREKDDVALYNQETGRITYRYRQSGKIRKQVDTIPSVYDPVSVAYYFRWRDLGVENRPRNMYGGRKVYQISSRILGNERIRTDHGEVDTIAVLPLIRRDGKPDDKGQLKIWFSNDERRVPVRLYAKFHKIKDWTLVGELMSSTRKAGG